MRPAMPSTPSEGNVLKASVIHSAALLCSLLSSWMWYLVGAFLKNHSWKPYRTMGRMHMQYSSHLWKEDRPLVELPSNFMDLIVEMLLVA